MQALIDAANELFTRGRDFEGSAHARLLPDRDPPSRTRLRAEQQHLAVARIIAVAL